MNAKELKEVLNKIHSKLDYEMMAKILEVDKFKYCGDICHAETPDDRTVYNQWEACKRDFHYWFCNLPSETAQRLLDLVGI